jgi:hypothetical protein
MTAEAVREVLESGLAKSTINDETIGRAA